MATAGLRLNPYLSVVPHPFRFIATMPPIAGDPAAWRDRVRRIEDLGFSTVAIADHFTRGWQMDPLTTLAAAAQVTSRLRLLTLVLGNDYRHPALVHRAAANIDVLSGGRLELGLGAGWMASDYEAIGMSVDPPSVRIARLKEAVEVISALFTSENVTHSGRHYRLDAMEGLPRPVQQPRPPIMLAGGGPKVLGLAGQVADIVGIHCRLPGADYSGAAVDEFGSAAIERKVDWVRQAAREAGRDPDGIELQFPVYLFGITQSRNQQVEARNVFGRMIVADPAVLADSPAVLVGSVEDCVDRLFALRERFGISYLRLGDDFEAAAPVVARLA